MPEITPLDCFSGLTPDRQRESKYSSSRLIRFRPYTAPVSLRDCPADREADAESLGFCRTKRFEKLIEMFRIGSVDTVFPNHLKELMIVAIVNRNPDDYRARMI